MKPNWIQLKLSLILLLTLGLGKTSAQINLTGLEVKRINETYARFDSAKAAGRSLLLDFKKTQDSLQVSRDSTGIWKQIAVAWQAVAESEKRKKKKWRNAAIGEAILISLGIYSKK